MTKKKLTDKQNDALETIKQFIEARHMTPTYKELSDILRIWPNAVRDRLKVLEKLGYLKLTPNIARGIVLL